MVDEKPTLSADLMVALVKKSADCEYFLIVETSSERCVLRTKRRGEPEPPCATIRAYSSDNNK